MIGFELSFKNEKISASISNGSLQVIVRQMVKSNGETNTVLHFTGLEINKNKYDYITWHKSELSVGDKVIIEIKDINKNTEPISIIEDNPVEMSVEDKLNTYRKLKKELEDNGLI